MKKNKELNKEKVLRKIKNKREKQPSKYIIKKRMNKRIKNSRSFTNVKNVTDNGILELKTGEVATILEVKAIDLSLTSKQEKSNFFAYFKTLFHIKDLNLKCYKLDEKLNLNSNKLNLDNKLNKYANDEEKSK